MERKQLYRNMIIDGIFPVIFWGFIYFLIAYLIVGYWTWELYYTWFITMVCFSPLNIISGRVVNAWRKLCKYEYKGYT